MMVTFLAVALLLAAGSWDAYVVGWLERGKPWTERLASGLTASYQLYAAAKTYPAIAWLFGFLSALVALDTFREAALVWWLVQGHIFFTMREVS